MKKNRNTLTPKQYALYTLLFHALAFCWYLNLLYVDCPGLSRKASLALLWLLTAGSSFFIYLKTRRKHRNLPEAFKTLAASFALYTLISYRQILSATYGLILLVFLAGLVLILALELYSCVLHPGRDGRALPKFFRRLPFECRTVCACFLTPLMVVALIFRLQHPFQISSLTYSNYAPLQQGLETASDLPSPVTLEDYFREFSLLREESFRALSAERKLELIQLYTDLQRTKLGLPFTLTVETAPLPDNTRGTYMPMEHKILLNLDQFTDTPSYELVRTINHESYHAYQHCLASLYAYSGDYRNLPVLKTAKQYRENFQTYQQSGKNGENFENYYSQTVEVDAREYDLQETELFFSQINEPIILAP